jgi:hypothetical protein
VRVDDARVDLQQLVGAGEEADQQEGEVGVLLVPRGAVGQAVEEGGQLAHDLGVQRGQPLAQLRAAQGRDADFEEEQVLLAVGGDLEEEVVERPRQRALGVEDGDLRHQGLALGLDDLIDGGDQELLLGVEVVVDEPGGQACLFGDALDGGVGEPVLEDRGAQPLDDLPPARLSEARTSHGLVG